MSKPTYILKLTPLPRADDPEGVRRLRRALKWLLRSCGLRCTSIEPALTENETGKGRDDAERT
jgi:hypothetical protein